MIIKWLLVAASVAFAAAGAAQDRPASSPGKAEKTVEGATAGRVAQIERCQGHKFESVIEIDPARKRSTRIKLCANAGSSDADWVTTLEAAIAQIEQRDMPAVAKDKLIGELEGEIAKFAVAPKPGPRSASKPPAAAPGSTLFPGGEGAFGSGLITPAERFETSTLPSLEPRKVTTAASGAIAASKPVKPMNVRLKCLSRGESGNGVTCDFFDRNTVLSVSAVRGIEAGATLRFLRRGEARGKVLLAAMPVGKSARVRLPTELCRGVKYSKVEIELLAPEAPGAVAERLGPYGLRC